MPQHVVATSLGDCRLVFEGETLTAFRLPESAATDPERLPPCAAPSWVCALGDRVRRHLEGHPEDFAGTPFDWSRVSPFERAVYEATLRVRPGQTATYGAVAAACCHPSSASRAVGLALGRNPWPLLVPCHRITGAGGRMTGYSGPGGVSMKLHLLALEGALLIGEA